MSNIMKVDEMFDPKCVNLKGTFDLQDQDGEEHALPLK